MFAFKNYRTAPGTQRTGAGGGQLAPEHPAATTLSTRAAAPATASASARANLGTNVQANTRLIFPARCL